MNQRHAQREEGAGTCSECGEPCAGVWQDLGIGSYEYHGYKGYDVQWCWVSECCEADVHDLDGNVQEPPDRYEDRL